MRKAKSLLGDLAQDMFSKVLKRFIQRTTPPDSSVVVVIADGADEAGNIDASSPTSLAGEVKVATAGAEQASTADVLKTLDLVTGGNHFSFLVNVYFAFFLCVSYKVIGMSLYVVLE